MTINEDYLKMLNSIYFFIFSSRPISNTYFFIRLQLQALTWAHISVCDEAQIM